MPRPEKLRAEFDNGAVLVNEFGIEKSRMTLNGILVINLSELFFEIEREAARHGWCSITRLYIEFGRYGTWKKDPAVLAALFELEQLKTIEVAQGVRNIKPRMTATRALKVIPKYVTSMELLAGLEELND